MQHIYLHLLLTVAVVGLCWLTSAVAAERYHGRVVGVTARTLTITDMTGQNQHTRVLASDATIHRRGRIVDLATLYPGDIVAITLERDGRTPTVANIEVLSAGN